MDRDISIGDILILKNVMELLGRYHSRPVLLNIYRKCVESCLNESIIYVSQARYVVKSLILLFSNRNVDIIL